MNLKLEQLESRLQALIEVRLLSALPGSKVEDLVIHKLASAMKSNLVDGPEDKKIAPNVFTLVVHPEDASKWKEQKLLQALIISLKIVGEEAGLQFATSPTITIMQNAEQTKNDMSVIASHQVEAIASTRGMTPTDETMPASHSPDSPFPQQAFLIIDGEKVFPLRESTINIGRRLDNQLVIDDPRMSRNHAQLRAIKGRYVIFDLNSTGGTFVNGQRTSQSVLYPGDVISLAGIPLVFGQDNPPPRPDLANTAPLNETSANQSTAILNRKTDNIDREDQEQG